MYYIQTTKFTNMSYNSMLINMFKLASNRIERGRASENYQN